MEMSSSETPLGSLSSLTLYKRDLDKVAHKLTHTERLEVAEQYHATQSFEFRDRLVLSVAPWVIKLAWGFARAYGFVELFHDLIQEGNLGVISAAERYDHRRGISFTTYATWWIRQRIGRYIMDHAEAIRQPVYLYNRLWKLRRYVESLERKTNERPTDEQIIAAGFSQQTLRMFARGQRFVQSLDAPLSTERDGSKITLKDIVSNGGFESFIAGIETVDAQLKVVEFLFRRFKERDVEIVKMRFGFLEWNGKQHTYEEIGKRFGVTRQDIDHRTHKVLNDGAFGWFMMRLSSVAARIQKTSPPAVAAISTLADVQPRETMIPSPAGATAAVKEREAVRCTNGSCSLVQYRTKNGLCRKCRTPLPGQEPEQGSEPPTADEPSSVIPGIKNLEARMASTMHAIRESKHLSQRQLAEKIGVPRTYISKIENGKAIPTLPSLERFADAFGMSMSELVERITDENFLQKRRLLEDPFLSELLPHFVRLTPAQQNQFLNAVRTGLFRQHVN
jgi:RNA polymerase sigma factor (sigma-70 family)